MAELRWPSLERWKYNRQLGFYRTSYDFNRCQNRVRNHKSNLIQRHFVFEILFVCRQKPDGPTYSRCSVFMLCACVREIRCPRKKKKTQKKTNERFDVCISYTFNAQFTQRMLLNAIRWRQCSCNGLTIDSIRLLLCISASFIDWRNSIKYILLNIVWPNKCSRSVAIESLKWTISLTNCNPLEIDGNHTKCENKFLGNFVFGQWL